MMDGYQIQWLQRIVNEMTENIQELKKAHKEWSELAEKLFCEKNKNDETVSTRNIR